MRDLEDTNNPSVEPMLDVADNTTPTERFFVAESTIHGRGLFAACWIPPHTLLGRYEGPTTEEDGDYVLWVKDDEGEWFGIDGENELRFVNHADDPNANFEGDELWTLRGIARGEEITHHYGDEFEA